MKTRILHLTEHLTFAAVVFLLMIVCWRPADDGDLTFVSANTQDHVPTWVWEKPIWDRCDFEDSRNCVWNAKRQGNGLGDSYLVTTKKRVIHLKHWQAYRLVRPNYAP